MKRFALLVLLCTGCLDSIVDNPCDDGYTLDDNGECVIEQAQVVTPPPPIAEQPEAPPVVPPTTKPPLVQPPEEAEPTPPGEIPTDGLSPCPTCR